MLPERFSCQLRDRDPATARVRAREVNPRPCGQEVHASRRDRPRDYNKVDAWQALRSKDAADLLLQQQPCQFWLGVQGRNPRCARCWCPWFAGGSSAACGCPIACWPRGWMARWNRTCTRHCTSSPMAPGGARAEWLTRLLSGSAPDRQQPEVRMSFTPDPSFYPSPRLAGEAPAEKLGYVVAIDPRGALGARGRAGRAGGRRSRSGSASYGSICALRLPNVGDELHHFGWNACSASLCPWAPNPHVERRYLIVPGLRSSRIYVFDTKPDGGGPRWSRPSSPRRSPVRPATRARTRSTAGPTAST